MEKERAFLFAGLIYRKGYAKKSLARLSAQFQAVILESKSIPFDFTSYYEREMGNGLIRKWVLFDAQIEQDSIVDIKQRCRVIEKEFSVDGNRRVNIDPGYITLSKIVLPTTKDCAHRIYLRDGIYAEITLMHYRGAWQPQPWTYPDYRSETAVHFFDNCRRAIIGKKR